MEKEKMYQLIEDYLQGYLSEEEKSQFEHSLKENHELKAEFELHKQIHGELNRDIIDLRKDLKDITSHPQRLKIKPSLRLFILRYGAIAAVLLIGIVYLPRLFSPIDEGKVFNEFYENYPMAINMRSAENSNELSLNAAINAYLQKDFKLAIESFSKMDSLETIHQFYWANALLAEEELGLAKEKFDFVIESADERLVQQAQWYKGLILIKENQINEAISYFETLNSDHYKKDEIKAILKKLARLL